MSTTINIWKQGYRPWVMGGDVNYVRTTKTTSIDRFTIRSFLFHVVKDNKDQLWAIENKSKGIVAGPQKDIKKLKEEITINFKGFKLADLRKQVDGGLEWYAQHDKVEKSAAEFWA